MRTIMPDGRSIKLAIGRSRLSQVPSVSELMGNYPNMDAREQREWAIRDRERLLTRDPIPAAVRKLVFDRDGHACVKCGATDRLVIDHIIPWSLCGPDSEDNFQTLCAPCNTRKGVGR